MADSAGVRLGAAAAKRLAALGSVVIELGLSDDEFARVEDDLGFAFADDHRAFLAAGLPVGAPWPNWRSEGRRSLTKRLQMPAEGVLFAVEWSDFWDDAWGKRPARMKDALRSARYQLARSPALVPVCAHNYLPGGRGSFGHPVMSIVRVDVAISGSDLADYIDNGLDSVGHSEPSAVPTVEFWSRLMS